MKSKKVITLSLSDLKDLGVLPRKNKKKNKKRKRRVKIVLVDPNTGAIIGGAKSDSSHMQGYAQQISQTPQFTNTANINSAIQEENLKAIERANKRAQIENQKEEVIEEQPKLEQNQKLLGYLEDRFSKIVENNNNLFGGIVPNLQRIENDNQQQKIINQQGFNMIQNLAGERQYFDITDNVGIGGNDTSSDDFQDQGKPNPVETTRFQTPVPKRSDTRFNASLNERDDNKTPSGISESLLKEMRDFNQIQDQYDDLIGTPINIQAVQKQLKTNDVLNLMENMNSNINLYENKIKNQSQVLRASQKDIFGDEDNEDDEGGDIFNDVDSLGKPDFNTPQKKALEKILLKSKKKNKAKYITVLRNYVIAGGSDDKILKSTNHTVIQRAYDKLIKNK